MPILLQVDFPYQGPWGEDMAQAMQGLAQSIAQEPGLLWKIWTASAAENRAGGVYLFADRAAAEAYHRKHAARLAALGIDGIEASYREIMAPLSEITRGPIR